MNTLKLKTLVMALALGLANSTFAGLVNINEADSEALAHHLKGVGTKKAEAIILYRGEHGAFADIEDLVNVKGIGEGILKKNLGDLSLSKGAIAMADDEVSVKKSAKTLKKPVVISKSKTPKLSDVPKPAKKKQTITKVDTKESSLIKKVKPAKEKKKEK